MKSERGGVDVATFKLSVPSLKSELLLLNHHVVQRRLITTTRSVSGKEVPLDLVCSLGDGLGPIAAGAAGSGSPLRLDLGSALSRICHPHQHPMQQAIHPFKVASGAPRE